jgi:ribosomal protein S18 acetylase RimI-like enzyme
VDVNVVFDRPTPSEDGPLALDVGECTAAAAPAVLDIAESCFRYTRFHLDPHVDRVVANRIKREWIANFVERKRGDRLFVAYVDGRPAGFLAALATEQAGARTAVIDLVGVATDAQRRGVGVSLATAFANHYRKTCSRLLVGTQVANVPSIRLYEKLGYSLRHSHYVLHKHAA